MLVPHIRYLYSHSAFCLPRLSRGIFVSLSLCRIVSLSLCLFVALSHSPSSFAQHSNEKGFYPIRNYIPKEYNALAQNWAITQDKRGVMYFANNQCILEYDGITWRTLLVTNESTIRSLTIDSNGVIYVGAADEFGFLQSDSTGNLIYNSLIPLVPESDRGFGDVWTCYVTNTGVYFQSSQKIFCYRDRAIKTWNAEETRSFHKMFYVYNTIFVRQRYVGLLQLSDDRLMRVPGGELFSKEDIYFMLPFIDSTKNKILINTTSRGLFSMDIPNLNSGADILSNFIKLSPLVTRIDPFFHAYQIYNGINLSNKTLSIGTNNKGLAIIDRRGNLIDFLSKDIGLQGESIKTQYSDMENNLWLALDNGIIKVDVTSPITNFNDFNGLSGRVEAITRFQDTLYAATSLGVFYLVPRKKEMTAANPSPEYPKFSQINDFSDECWALVSLEDITPPQVLVAANKGVFQIEKGMAKRVIVCNPWTIYRSSINPLRVYIGLVDGLGSLYWNKNKWVYEGPFSGIEDEIRSITEDTEGTLWLGTSNGIIRVKLNLAGGPHNNAELGDEVAIHHSDSSDGLPEGNSFVAIIHNEILVAGESGLYKLQKGKFFPDSSFGTKFIDGTRGIHRLQEDKLGNVWLPNFPTGEGAMEFGFAKRSRDASFKLITTPFKAFSDELPSAIFPESDGIVWLGGAMGIMRFDFDVFKNYDIPYNALIRKVTHKDSVLFNGIYYDENKYTSLIQPPELNIAIPYILNSLTFEFSATSYNNEDRTKFSYFLEEFDKSWTEWQDETKAVYTNLPEGTYFFHVKAKNIYGNESHEAIYEFTILPPWYRTWWAYLSYVLLFIGFVYVAIDVSTRGLQSIIRQRTAEVVKQKEIIEAKNHDIMDSINYAKRIQDTLLPHAKDILTMFPKHFILYKPRDIVSGDFYWCGEKNGKYLITAADCTGHGVPGALMSMIGHSLLNEIVMGKGVTKPCEVLDLLRQGIIKSLGQTGQSGEQKDGMDMVLLAVDFPNMKLEFAGANNPFYVVRKTEIIETKADKMPIGIYGGGVARPFTHHEVPLLKGDKLIMSSDGYPDQFGGPDGKKFMKKRFKELLFTIYDQPMTQQKITLDNTLEEWKVNTHQMDDVLVIGIEI